MKSNKLITHKENIFTKISKFFKKLFFRKKNKILECEDRKFVDINNPKENFIENITIKEDEEEKRLRLLQLKYDNGEIDEADISDEDVYKLMEMYQKETERLNADTETRKKHITQMLKELKSS